VTSGNDQQPAATNRTAQGDFVPAAGAASADPDAVPVRPAATVMMIRSASTATAGTNELEVFMLRRTGRAAFGAGMFVFPGGRVDPSDSDAALAAVCVGRTDAEASAELGIDHGGLAYWVAAVRECFEEAGILLGRRADGADGPLGFDADARTQVHDSSLALSQLCVDHDLVLDLSTTEYVAHWITPKGEGTRRFDTRFFVAAAPPDQEGVHDDSETVASLWVTQSEALRMYSDGEMTMMPPTLASLRWLAEFTSVEAALAAGRELSPPTILPKLRRSDDGSITGISMPGDDDYDALD